MSVPVYVSPVGRLVFPYLNRPRQFKGEGAFAYDTQLDVEGVEGAVFAQFLESYAEGYAKRVGKKRIGLDSIIRAAVSKGRTEPLEDTIRFAFKVKNREAWDRKPAFYREDGSTFEVEPEIGAGTICEVAYTILEWKAGPNYGLSLQPAGLRIHELVSGLAAAPESMDYETLFRSRSTPPGVIKFPGSPTPPNPKGTGGGGNF